MDRRGFLLMSASLAAPGVGYASPDDVLAPSGDATGETDTGALAAAVARPGAMVRGRPGALYHLNAGVSCAAGVRLEDFRFRLVMGEKGFSSREVAAGRYDRRHCALCWSRVDGGGYDNLEIFGSAPPGAGGDYVALPIAVNGGMTSRPFRGGRAHIHDLTLVTCGIALNSVGAAGWSLGDTLVEDCGTDKLGADWWTANGGVARNINPTGVGIDGDLFDGVISSRGSMGRMTCRNIFVGDHFYAADGYQSDFITLAGTGANTNGCDIAFIDAERVGEPLDCQQAHVRVGGVRARDCGIGVKLVHGAQDCVIGPVEVRHTDVAAVGVYGSSAVAKDTKGNRIGPVTGSGAAERIMLAGRLVSAGDDTAVLPASAKAIDNYYRAREAVIVTTGGAGAGQERQISGYSGASRTATLSTRWSVVPDETTSFVILPWENRATVLFALEAKGRVIGNLVIVGEVVNEGLRKDDLYSNLTTADSGNVVVLQRAGTGKSQVRTPGSARLVTGPTP